ncbi:MAG: hypothetical protein Q9170_000426 [Blastenia crenularia]
MYVRYAESGRVNWIQNFAKYHDLEHGKQWEELCTPRGDGMILRSIKTDFKFPMSYPDRISVYHKLGFAPADASDSFILDVLILSERHRRPAARCLEDIVLYDYGSGHKVPLRPFILEQFNKTWQAQEDSKEKNRAKIEDLLERVRRLELASLDKGPIRTSPEPKSYLLADTTTHVRPPRLKQPHLTHYCGKICDQITLPIPTNSNPSPFVATVPGPDIKPGSSGHLHQERAGWGKAKTTAGLMPRAGKKAANQHNTRHENGVVAPGKRITKQKSNGNIAASPDGPAGSHAFPSASPSAAPPASPLQNNVTNALPSTSKHNRNRINSTTKYPEENSEDLSEDFESMGNGEVHANGSLEHNHRRIDVNAAKGPSLQDNTIFSLALTILRSCPLGDTMAILIFLLSLPSTLLSVTNALFAVLTFIPPAASFSSIPTTFNDIFQGSSGAPSLATILVTDALGIVIWLVAWSPLQALGLELAQAVVATTLGGGNSSRSSGSDSTLFCMLLVFLTHVARHKWVPKRIFGYEWSVRLASISYIPEDYSSEAIKESQQPRSAGGWFRVLVALHILIQGLVHVARRWYTKREYTQTVNLSKKGDPEAGGSAQTHPDNGVPAMTGSTELPSKISLPISKEAREKISHGKKRRKQGTYVRRQQPLWAAFAATKVTVLREMEQSHALSEALGRNATDTKNLGSAHFVTEEGRMWITLVQPNSFYFDTSYFSSDYHDEASSADLSVSAGIDRSKPFFVRINGADWTSSRIKKLSTYSSKDGSSDQQWTGEVYGLSPSSTYNCSFVRSEDGVVMYSAMVSTPSSPVIERESSGVASPPQPTVRPSSPTTPSTTLKKSIAACEVSLGESQARLKRNKKEHRAGASALKREIEKLNTSIAKQNEMEKSQTSRQLQFSQNTKQADEACTVIDNEIQSVSQIPEDEMEDWRAKETAWEEHRKRSAATKEDCQRCKSAAHREKQAIEAEASSTQQKRERLQGRKAKLSEQYERLQAANSQELDEKERKEGELAARLASQRQVEERANEQLAAMIRTIQETQYHTQQLKHQAETLASALQMQQNMGLTSDHEPGLAGGNVPGGVSHGMPSSGLGFRFPSFTSADNGSIQNGIGSFRQDTRPRSSSLLAGSTPYSDFLDQDPAPPMPSSQVMRLVRGRQQSGSSGSGSNGNSSQRDPASPVSALGNRKSPVVKKSSPVWN